MKIFLYLFFGSFLVQSFAQSFERCSFVLMDSVANGNHIEKDKQFENWIKSKQNQKKNVRTEADTARFKIPVIVHVVHNGELMDIGANISYEQVKSQILVLNEDFNRIYSTPGYNTDINGANINVEFVLATHDPTGNLLAEPGVDRYDGNRAAWNIFLVNLDLKPKTIWNPDDYFNIWTINLDGFKSRFLLGYAQFPDQSSLPGLNTSGGSAATDGVVVDYQFFGSRDKGDFPSLAQGNYGKGRTCTHEVGHWLGLRHIWGDGPCEVDDYCDDTPASDSANYGCQIGRIRCGGVQMIENYMDYSDDACMNIFTKNQKERIDIVLQNSPRRKSLAQNTNYVRLYPQVVEPPTIAKSTPNTSSQSPFQIYPNPSNSHFFANWEKSATYEWKLIDIYTGLIIKTGSGNDRQTTIFFDENNHLGLFLFEIKIDTVVYHTKIIRN
ncbi:MAG: M43 family zinc metalloprotease [Cytophagales bacterium]